VLDAVGESPEWASYNKWAMYLPGDRIFSVSSGDAAAFGRELARVSRDPREAAHFAALQRANLPLSNVIAAIPPIALRADLGAVQTAAPYAKRIDPLMALKMVAKGIDPSGPFSKIVTSSGIPTESLTNWFFEFLSFALQGQGAAGTPAAGVSFMMREFFAPGAVMDWPVGGSGKLVEALVRAVEKGGGKVLAKARVDELVVDASGRCTGARLADGREFEATTAVLCNADVWTTANRLLPERWRPAAPDAGVLDPAAPQLPSFMHLHVGFRADGIDLAALGVHHIVARDLKAPIDAADNLVFVCLPGALDSTLAPEGYATLHAYLPATESYDDWAGLDVKSEAYRDKKEARSAALWAAVERFIPDIRERAVVDMVGSPLTHAKFLNRDRGTYGPAYVAGVQGYPSPKSPVDGLWCVGEGSFPGIGVPAVAGNAAGAANTIATLGKHKSLLERLVRGGKIPAPPP